MNTRDLLLKKKQIEIASDLLSSVIRQNKTNSMNILWNKDSVFLLLFSAIILSMCFMCYMAPSLLACMPFIVSVGCYCYCMQIYSWPKQRHVIGDLPDEDMRKIEDVFMRDSKYFSLYDMKITTASTRIKNRLAVIEKKILSNILCHNFLRGKFDPDSPIPAGFPNDVVCKIFYYAGLFAKPPIECDLSQLPRDLKFTFIEENSITGVKLQPYIGKYELISNEKLAIEEIKKQKKQIENLSRKYHRLNAGIVSQDEVPVYYTKLKRNYFTFFLGRDDELSIIPEIMSKEVFQRINAHGGLFK